MQGDKNRILPKNNDSVASATAYNYFYVLDKQNDFFLPRDFSLFT